MKTKEDVFSELSTLMHELYEVPVDSIKLESNFYEDLGLDSIDAIDLIGQFQGIIGERINPEDFKNVDPTQEQGANSLRIIQVPSSFTNVPEEKENW